MAFDQDEQDDPSGGSASVFSRRSFLKTVGGTSLAAGVLSPTLGEAQTGPAAVGPGDKTPAARDVPPTVFRKERLLKTEAEPPEGSSCSS